MQLSCLYLQNKYVVESLHYNEVVDLHASCITQLRCCFYLVLFPWYFDENVSIYGLSTCIIPWNLFCWPGVQRM